LREYLNGFRARSQFIGDLMFAHFSKRDRNLGPDQQISEALEMRGISVEHVNPPWIWDLQ
jgi:hypothetical protein